MRLIIGLIFLIPLASQGFAQSNVPAQNSGASSQTRQAPVIQTEKVLVPETMQAPPPSMASQPGFMQPAQIKQLLVKIWQSEERIRDLTGQVHPESVKMPPVVASNLERNLAAVKKGLDSLEGARARFASRPDSEYFGFETYSGMTLVLPRLSEVADPVYRYQNENMGSEIRQAWNDLFALEQALAPYITFLTRNHDQIYALTQGNLYNCQDQLNRAVKTEHATPMRNILPEFKGHPRHKKKASSPAQDKKD